MPGEEEGPFLTAEEGTEIVMSTFWVTAEDIAYTLPVIATGEKVLSNYLDPYQAKLPACIGILIIIPAAEIGETTLEGRMEGVSTRWKVLWLLFFLW